MNKLHLIITSLWLLLLAGGALAQADSRAEVQMELELSRQLLRQLEESSDSMDPRLVEPIEQIADRLMALGEFEQAHTMLDRALQITRISEGLYTQGQLPFLYKKIENFANQGNWARARQQMEYLRWLYRTKPMRLTEDLLARLQQMSNFHLRAVLEDGETVRAYHFRQAVQIKWMTLSLAERIWGESDPRMVPILYSQINQFYLQKVAVDRGGSTGYALRELMPGSRIVRERKVVRDSYYFTGISLLNRMTNIYADEESPNLEGIAMTSLYLADWQALYNRPEQARLSYRLAHQRLLEAEIDPGLINELFSQPLILPAPEFYPSVSQALQSREVSGVDTESQERTDVSPLLSFSEWSNDYPNVRNPIFASTVQEDSNFALFSFSLAGFNEVSRWVRGSYTLSVSEVNEAELLGQNNYPADIEESLLQRINLLRFRPKLIDGEVQPATGVLRYQLAADTLF